MNITEELFLSLLEPTEDMVSKIQSLINDMKEYPEDDLIEEGCLDFDDYAFRYFSQDSIW